MSTEPTNFYERLETILDDYAHIGKTSDAVDALDDLYAGRAKAAKDRLRAELVEAEAARDRHGRDRDEARTELRYWRERAEKAEAERDSWRDRALDPEWRESYVAAHAVGRIVKERDEQRQRAERAEAERDQARAERDGMRDLFEAAHAVAGERTDQRDRLAEQAKAVRELVETWDRRYRDSDPEDRWNRGHDAAYRAVVDDLRAALDGGQ